MEEADGLRAHHDVIGHLEGLCHIYVDKTADLKMAKKIISEVVSKKSLRRKKELVDSVSATIILQSYLEKNNRL